MRSISVFHRSRHSGTLTGPWWCGGMMMRTMYLALVALATLTLATETFGAVPFQEDLSACKLPNGVILLPAPGTRQAAGGELFKISSGAFSRSPAGDDGKVATPAQVLEK